jgi:flagellar basal-body rod modification protein FlgD
MLLQLNGWNYGKERRLTMAAMAGLLNHSMTAAQQALSGSGASSAAAGTAATGSSDASSSADSSSSTISANDFLTLLVTEMQNQDPTADTDPNEYINQLVQVNSLEQLIDINQNLSTALGSPGSSSGSDTTTSQAAGGQTASPLGSVTAEGPAATAAPLKAAAHKTGAPAAAHPAGSRAAAGISQFANSQFAKSQLANSPSSPSAAGPHAPGNLGIPKAVPAAHKVAQALDGHSRPLKPLRKVPGEQ